MAYNNKKDKDVTSEALEAYNVTLRFWSPKVVTLTVAAKDQEGAVEFVKEMSQDYRDVEILQTYLLKDVPEIEEIILGSHEEQKKATQGLN